MEKRAVILAGGKGTRLRPYTIAFPKPLVPIDDLPIVEVVTRQLMHYGFSRITLAVNHQAELIKAFFNGGKVWSAAIDFSQEHTPLGTMGPLRLIHDLPEHFLVMNGDILTDLDYHALYEAHVASGRLMTISAFERVERSEFGILDVDENLRLTGFTEKPARKTQVSMGVYMLSRGVLDFIPEGRPFGFDDLMYSLLEQNVPVGVLPHQGFWLDIGRPEDYEKADEIFHEQRELFLK